MTAGPTSLSLRTGMSKTVADSNGTKNAGPIATCRKRETIVNALSVDIEDYFHVGALSERIDRGDWENLPRRVELNTDIVLAMLDKHNAEATFFILGWVAERCPDLVRRIADAGHEIGSHGHSHISVHEQDPKTFKADIERTRSLLEDISGVCVRGYRAANFSISPDMEWAYEILRECGYRYSSSLHPIQHDVYRMPDAPRHPFVPWSKSGIVEIPISTLHIAGKRVPFCGGGFFRLLPYGLSRRAIRRINKNEQLPCTFYFHPWEIDPDQPRVKGLSARSRFRHYTNLSRMQKKLETLLNDFEWSRIDEIYQSVIAS